MTARRPIAGDEGSRWELFSHEADVGVRGIGPSPAAAFEQAALALTGAVVAPEVVAARQEVEIRCRAGDLDTLLYDWLNDLVYAMATRRLLFGRYAVRIDGDRLEGRAWGEPLAPERHRPATEPKGATYTALTVHQQPDGSWLAQCVVDV
jgi:SHS2 domain-containing protein